MVESKIVATDRLRRENRWEMATQWRDEKRKQLRAKGLTKAKSNEESWDSMLKQFPPLPSSEMPDGIELVDITPDDSQPDLARDMIWVYGHLNCKTVTTEDAPSPGAWCLLRWVRGGGRSLDRFFSVMLPKAMAIEEKRPAHSPSMQELEDESEGKPPEDLFAVINREIREEREAVGKNTESDGGSWGGGMPVLSRNKVEIS
jgi:hypothetical protein